MKRFLLLLILWGLVRPASAQYELAAYGVVAGISMLKGQPQKPNEFVTQQYYHNRSFQQKRTPADKLPKKGGAEIAALEKFLTDRYTVLLANDTSAVLSPELEANFVAASSRVTTARPLWNVDAYGSELNLYQNEERLRYQARDQAARQRQNQHAARLRRIEFQKDSIFRAALRRTQEIEMQRLQSAVKASEQVDGSESLPPEVTDPATRTITATKPAAVRVTPHTASKKPAIKKTKVVVKAKRSSGPRAYYCASGNTVKYHTSPSCRGLNACRASVQPMSMSEARQSMDACRWCN